MCNECNNQVNEDKELGTNSNLLKPEHPDQFGHKHPYFNGEVGLFVIDYLHSSSILLCFVEKIMNGKQLTVVEEYEIVKPLIHKRDSFFDNCIRDCHNMYFHTF